MVKPGGWVNEESLNHSCILFNMLKPDLVELLFAQYTSRHEPFVALYPSCPVCLFPSLKCTLYENFIELAILKSPLVKFAMYL